MMKVHKNPPRPLPSGKKIFFYGLKIITFLLFVNSASASPTALLAEAKQGNTNAQYQLAISLLQQKEHKPNYAEVVKWLQLAAEKGHARAQYSLALRYLFGQGVQKNNRTAVAWLQQAANQDLSDAQFSLGLRYFWGQGVKKDLGQAGLWFNKAAQQGHPKATQFLSKLPTMQPTKSQAQAEPNNTEQLIKAHVLASLAIAKGDEKALLTKQHLEETMTAAEVMLAIQRTAKQNQSKPSAQIIGEKFTKLSEKLKSAEDYFLEGNRLIKRGELQLAIPVFEKSLELAPKNASSHRNLASAYAHIGENRNAIENLQKSIDLSPGQAAKHAMLGLILHTDGNLAAALKEYRRAARLNPGIGWIYPDMADIFIQQKNYPDAWKAIRQAELLGHANQRISNRLARLASAAEISPQTALQADMHLRQLVLATRQTAKSSLKELQKGTDFSSLTKQLAAKKYQRNGGYWGPYQPELLAPEFAAVLKGLPPLSFSPIVETEAGFHILQKFPCFKELLAEH